MSASSGSDAASIDHLVELARAARERAYAPYRRFFVGAAVATDAGPLRLAAFTESGGTAVRTDWQSNAMLVRLVPRSSCKSWAMRDLSCSRAC